MICSAAPLVLKPFVRSQGDRRVRPIVKLRISKFGSLGQTNSYIKEVDFLSAPSNFLAQ